MLRYCYLDILNATLQHTHIVAEELVVHIMFLVRLKYNQTFLACGELLYSVAALVF